MPKDKKLKEQDSVHVIHKIQQTLGPNDVAIDFISVKHRVSATHYREMYVAILIFKDGKGESTFDLFVSLRFFIFSGLKYV